MESRAQPVNITGISAANKHSLSFINLRQVVHYCFKPLLLSAWPKAEKKLPTSMVLIAVKKNQRSSLSLSLWLIPADTSLQLGAVEYAHVTIS